MPEFILDHGDSDTAARFAKLDSFTQGYIEAMFFTNTGSAYDEDLEDATVAELSEDAWSQIIADCAAFQEMNADDLQEVYDQDKANYGEIKAGRDYWYGRNGHGVGYWDRGLMDIGEKLGDIASACCELDLVRGDDGLLYLEG